MGLALLLGLGGLIHQPELYAPEQGQVMNEA